MSTATKTGDEARNDGRGDGGGYSGNGLSPARVSKFPDASSRSAVRLIFRVVLMLGIMDRRVLKIQNLPAGALRRNA